MDSALTFARAQTPVRFLNLGFYVVKDRIFGNKADADNPDQGGSSLYAEGVHYFPNGFIAAADVNVTSNLAFRQVFSDNIQQAISPEERSQVFVNKDHNDYSFNFLARSQVTSLPNSRIRIREFPSISIEKRGSPLSFLKKLPVYFSFEASADGVSRKETVEDLIAFRTRRARRSDHFAINGSATGLSSAHPIAPIFFWGFNHSLRGWTRHVLFKLNRSD